MLPINYVRSCKNQNPVLQGKSLIIYCDNMCYLKVTKFSNTLNLAILYLTKSVLTKFSDSMKLSIDAIK